jgi:hypothetical protein
MSSLPASGSEFRSHRATPIVHRAIAACIRFAAASLALALAGTTAHAQIITENAGVLSPQTPELHEAFTFTRAASGTDRAWVQQVLVSTDRANEFQLTQPWIDRSVDSAGGDLDFAGWGDVSLRWKHALSREDDVMRSTRWSTIVELEAPTGDRQTTDGSLAIPQDVRISRGDWTFGGGLLFARVDDRQRFAAEIMYRHHTSHDGFQLGDSLELNLAYWYRISPARFVDLEQTVEVRGVLELLSSYRFEAELDGDGAQDDGGIVWIAPGLQVFPQDWLLFQAAVELPVVQDIDDAFGDREFAAVISVKFLF